MKIPRILFGKGGEVSRRMKPLVAQVLAGCELDQLDFGEMIDTRDEPKAFIFMNENRGHSGFEPHFLTYAFLYALLEARSARKGKGDEPERAFLWSLQRPWSFLGTCGQAGLTFFLKVDPAKFPNAAPHALTGRPEHWLAYLLAADRFWNEIEAEGARFDPIRYQGSAFAEYPNTVHQVLGLAGMPMDPHPRQVPGLTRTLLTRALSILAGPS